MNTQGELMNKPEIQSIRRLRQQADQALLQADCMLRRLRETCQHRGALQALGVVLCPECGASWGAEDRAAPKSRSCPVAEMGVAERQAPQFSTTRES